MAGSPVPLRVIIDNVPGWKYLAAIAGEAAEANHRELQGYRNKAAKQAEIAVAAHVAKVRAQGGAS